MKWISNMFRNDKVLLVLSFLVAVALWMMVVGQRNPQTVNVLRGVEVAYTGTETMEQAGLKIISASNTTADVKILGRISEMYKVTLRDVAVTADLSGINRPGTYEIPLSAQVNQTGVSVESVNPGVITVQADFIVKNKRDVEVRFKGELPEGYEQGVLALSVTSVTVEGPENTLKGIAKAVAEVDLSHITENISASYPLKLVNAEGDEISSNNLTVSATEVWVDLEILRVKTVPVQIVLDGEVDLSETGHTVEATPAAVVVKGEKSVIDGLEKIETEPILRDAIPEQTGTAAAKLVLPEGAMSETTEVVVAFHKQAQQ